MSKKENTKKYLEEIFKIKNSNKNPTDKWDLHAVIINDTIPLKEAKEISQSFIKNPKRNFYRIEYGKYRFRNLSKQKFSDFRTKIINDNIQTVWGKLKPNKVGGIQFYHPSSIQPLKLDTTPTQPTQPTITQQPIYKSTTPKDIKAEDYLSKSQLENMKPADYKKFKEHPEWFGIDLNENEPIHYSDEIWNSMTEEQRKKAIANPYDMYGEKPTISNYIDERELPTLQLEQAQSNQAKYEDQMAEQRQKELEQAQMEEDERVRKENEPSTFDQILSGAMEIGSMFL